MQEYIYGPQWRSTESPTAPLGLMYLATPLIKADYRVDFIDFTVDQLNQEDYFEALKNADFSNYSITCGGMVKYQRAIRYLACSNFLWKSETFLICFFSFL